MTKYRVWIPEIMGEGDADVVPAKSHEEAAEFIARDFIHNFGSEEMGSLYVKAPGEKLPKLFCYRVSVEVDLVDLS